MKQPLENLRTAWAAPRWRRALLIAAVSDALGFTIIAWPPAVWLLDAVTVAALLKVLGFRWPLLFALAIEAIPVLEVFPAWTLVVAALAATDAREPRP